MTLKTADIIGLEEHKDRPLHEKILNWYRQGYFDVEVAAELEIPVQDFYTQMEQNAAFGRLVNYGRTLCESYWVSQSRNLMKNKSMNSQPWVFVMKNKFNWADKSEQVETGNSTTNLDELKRQLNAQVARFVKQYQPELQSAERALLGASSDNE